MKSLLLQIHLLSLASSFMIFAGDSSVTIITNSLAMELAVIPSGSFIMGEDKQGDWDESPAHAVRISNSFSVSTEEISLEQYQQFRPEHNCSLNGKATGMSWYDAIAFCGWLSKREGKPYRLPTEAEWE